MPEKDDKLDKGSKQQAEAEARERRVGARNEAPAGVQPVEPEDASRSGAGREQQRELLEKNVAGHGKGRPAAQPLPDTPAGQHATGSGTGEAKR